MRARCCCSGSGPHDEADGAGQPGLHQSAKWRCQKKGIIACERITQPRTNSTAVVVICPPEFFLPRHGVKCPLSLVFPLRNFWRNLRTRAAGNDGRLVRRGERSVARVCVMRTDSGVSDTPRTTQPATCSVLRPLIPAQDVSLSHPLPDGAAASQPKRWARFLYRN